MSESTTGIEGAVATINRRLNFNPDRPKSALAGFSNKIGIDIPLIGLEFSEDPTNQQRNWRVVSTSKHEYDFIARKNDPAHLVITPIGKDYLRKHPGFLKKIASGDLVEDWVSQTGTGSIAVHPAEFPETVVKYIRFGKTGMKVPAREVYYRVPLELDPDTAHSTSNPTT